MKRIKSAALLNTETDSRFSNANQPPAELKKLGWAKRKILSQILQAKLPCPEEFAETEAIKQLAATFGIEPKKLTIELAMHLKMVHKAIYDGDVSAYEKVMNRAYGLPVMPIASNNKSLVEIRVVTGSQAVEEASEELIPKAFGTKS